MDNWRKAQIAAKDRNGLLEVIANGHRFAGNEEVKWAEVCLVAYDQARVRDDADDAAIDAWHEGYFAGRANKLVTGDPHFASGWFKGRCETLYPVKVTMPDRPEGYYHAPLGAFD
ncbi:hypothetical protein D2T29_12395 [Sinirhodobacter populi]|uniref:Uncharacterized protein n=1 Tax=Paenirhodobacter populi TaxID=2306993 RepID=A0A443KCE8_9RHOB|nr:hypothetical protein [Sinirhodobacter populi]RWR30464.1 hypothetical protein D2T29_12395 [Sinirhodobacter populi]